MRMTRLALTFSISLSLLFVQLACDPAKKTENIGTTDSSANDANTDGVADLKISKPTISSMIYQAETHSIILNLEYSGCSSTKHVFKLDGICAESYPMQCGAKLFVPKSFDSSCKMMIREELVAVLEDGFDTSYVSLSSADGKTSSVLVDRTGKIPKN